jgi:hypothetical protein
MVRVLRGRQLVAGRVAALTGSEARSKPSERANLLAGRGRQKQFNPPIHPKSPRSHPPQQREFKRMEDKSESRRIPPPMLRRDAREFDRFEDHQQRQKACGGRPPPAVQPDSAALEDTHPTRP